MKICSIILFLVFDEVVLDEDQFDEDCVSCGAFWGVSIR